MNVNRGMAPGQLFTVLGKDQSALVREVDEKVKNKWNFRWIEEEIHVKELERIIQVPSFSIQSLYS